MCVNKALFFTLFDVVAAVVVVVVVVVVVCCGQIVLRDLTVFSFWSQVGFWPRVCVSVSRSAL